jgi:hypothetical protein
MVKFNDIASHLTGISCPLFGVSWTPPASEREAAKRLIAFLEDRRVLYNASELEVPEHCVQSIIEIRHHLTDELTKLDNADELANHLRAMRAACRQLLNTVQAGDRYDIVRFGNYGGHNASWIFMSALGQMRGVFGVHIAQLAAAFGLDIEDDLAVILPGNDDGRDDEQEPRGHRRTTTPHRPEDR